MRDWNSQARNREARLARAAPPRPRQAGAGRRCGRPAGSGAGTRRPRLPGGQQPEAGRLPGTRHWLPWTPAGSTICTWCSRCWPCPNISTCSSAASRRKLDFSFSGPQGARLARMVGGRADHGRGHPHLSGAVRPLLRRSDAQGQPGGGAGRRRRRQPLHRPQHRGHAGHRRGDRLQARHRHRPGQRDWSTRCRGSTFPATGSTSSSRAPRPHYIEPLFTRDPAADLRDPGADGDDGHQGHLRRVRGATASTTASASTPRPSSCCCRPTPTRLGLKGKICRHWALNPHPALIPAIEAGFVESVHSFGSEIGMEDYIRARPDVFFTGAGRQPAVQPRPVPGGRALCLRPVHRLDAADRPRRQQLDRDARAHRRLRRRAQHGRRRARAAATPARRG